MPNPCDRCVLSCNLRGNPSNTPDCIGFSNWVPDRATLGLARELFGDIPDPPCFPSRLQQVGGAWVWEDPEVEFLSEV